MRIGDPITLADEFDLLRNDLAVARAFDNRIGTFAVAEALRLLKESKGKLQAEVCAVSNVQEEVGLLGARQIAYSLKPDVALVVDVTHATDYPTVSKPQHGDMKIGKGPAHHARRLQSSRSRRAHRSGGEGEEDSAPARSDVRNERHGHGRDFLDARRHRQRADQSAEPLHALAGGGREPERSGTDSATAGRVRASLKKGEQFKVKI